MAYSKEQMQEIFDIATVNVIKQGERCVLNSGCRYSQDNNHCALGWYFEKRKLVRDWDDIEGNIPMYDGITRTVNSVARLAGAKTKTDVAFLRALQQAHDETLANINVPFVEMFYIRCALIADIYKLEYHAMMHAYNERMYHVAQSSPTE